jgi:hypothetical protein
LQLPADALPQAQYDSKSRARVNVAPRGQTQSRSKSEQLAEQRQLSEPRPMQVLFVVVDQAAASKPASPTATPKTSAPAKTNAKPSQPQEQDGAA